MATPDRPLARKILFAGIVFAGFLVLLEAAMFLADPWLGSGFYRYDPDLGFRARPHAGGANRFGFNDRDHPLEKPPGSVRILVVGDSFGWVGGREGNYTAILERLAAERHGPGRVEVVNTGYPMTHTGEQLAMLRKFGLRYGPDLVVLGFFVGNDFLDAHPHRKRIVVNGVYFDVDRRRERTLLGRPLVPRSRLVGFVRQRLGILGEALRPGARVVTDAYEKVHGRFSPATYLRIERNRLAFCDLRRHREGVFAARVAFALGNLTAMSELLRSRDVGFVVALLPDEFQVDARLRERVMTAYGLDPADHDLELPQRIVREHLRPIGVPVVDMLPAFRSHARDRALYLPRNTHWSRAGNELAARLLLDHLAPWLDARLGADDPDAHGRLGY